MRRCVLRTSARVGMLLCVLCAVGGCKTDAKAHEELEAFASNEANASSGRPASFEAGPACAVSGANEANASGFFSREAARRMVAGLEPSEDTPATRIDTVEGFAAEGAMLTFFSFERRVRLIELEGRGESRDMRLLFYYDEVGRPIYARAFVAFDPAKLMAPEDEGYIEAREARAAYDTRYFFHDGGIVLVEDSGPFPHHPVRVYDEHSNLIMYDGPGYRTLSQKEEPAHFMREELLFYARALFAVPDVSAGLEEEEACLLTCAREDGGCRFHPCDKE